MKGKGNMIQVAQQQLSDRQKRTVQNTSTNPIIQLNFTKQQNRTDMFQQGTSNRNEQNEADEVEGDKWGTTVPTLYVTTGEGFGANSAQRRSA